MDRRHNVPGTACLEPDVRRAESSRSLMVDRPMTLDRQRRRVVLEAIRRTCSHREWTLFAAHVRSTHVHVVAASVDEPERVMGDLKAYASRALTNTGLESSTRRKWSRHGSTRWLWEPDSARAAIDYVVRGQGTEMAVYESPMLWRELP